MLRGVITLTSEEAEEALKTLPESQKQRPIYYKITAGLEPAPSEVRLQVSEDELEMLMDNLGIPIPTETEAKKSLRIKLQNFLVKLKNQ